MTLKVGSLFSGIGGIEIGFEKQGFETEWFVENELYAQTILRKRFPKAKIYGDITKLDFKTISKVDILTGGFPCQDISNAGKRAGIEGSRSSLWKHYLRAISTIQPRYALIENVSALLRRGLDTVLCDIAKIGYDAEWYCIPASSVGALHQRDRIFIIAYPNSNGNRFNITTNRGKEKEIWNENNKSIISEQCGKIDGEQDVSNTTSDGCKKGSTIRREISEETRGSKFNKCDKTQRTIANTNEQGWSRKRKTEMGCKELRNGWWAIEPELGRVAHGIPNRMDRIRCLGNSVVPQLAEIFAEAIKIREEIK